MNCLTIFVDVVMYYLIIEDKQPSVCTTIIDMFLVSKGVDGLRNSFSIYLPLLSFGVSILSLRTSITTV